MWETQRMRSTKTVFTKASDKIRAEIERLVQTGTLLPGDAIDEAGLASQHGVSRTPIREAMIQLQAQGLLTSMPRGGMLVAKMDLQQLLSLWELLAELEAVAARLACQRMTPDELLAIAKANEQGRAAVELDDRAAWQACNLAFHELIYRATRNPYLRQDVLRIRARTGFYRQHAFGALGKIKTSFEQHQRLVEAFQAGDADAASAAMVAHMRPARDAQAMSDFIINLPKGLSLA